MHPDRRHDLMLLCLDQTVLVMAVAAIWMVAGLALLDDAGAVIMGVMALVVFAFILGAVTIYLSATEGKVAQRASKPEEEP
jgi:uncharacterized membrane-anchored protein